MILIYSLVDIWRENCWWMKYESTRSDIHVNSSFSKNWQEAEITFTKNALTFPVCHATYLKQSFQPITQMSPLTKVVQTLSSQKFRFCSASCGFFWSQQQANHWVNWNVKFSFCWFLSFFLVVSILWHHDQRLRRKMKNTAKRQNNQERTRHWNQHFTSVQHVLKPFGCHGLWPEKCLPSLPQNAPSSKQTRFWIMLRPGCFQTKNEKYDKNQNGM